MKKRVYGRKLHRTTNERKRLFRNLINSFIERGFLVTTIAKAKSVQPTIEQLITGAKTDSLTSYRQSVSETGQVATAKSLKELGTLFAKRSGGYTRLIRLGSRLGDNAELVRLELVEQLIKPEVEVVIAPKVAEMPVKPETKILPAIKKVVEVSSKKIKKAVVKKSKPKLQKV